MCGKVYVGETGISLRGRVVGHAKSLERGPRNWPLANIVKSGHRMNSKPLIDQITVLDRESRDSHKRVRELIHI